MTTAELTERYFQRLGDDALREHGTRLLGRTGYRVAAVGFGGYHIDLHDPGHRKALEYALTHGINLIDTSSNYGDGGSELLIGETLKQLIRHGQLVREEVVIVSKAGYVQGSNLERAREREAADNPFPDMVKYAEGCWHCIHPEFLEDQLNHTLQRLQQDTLDIYLLHNPEYFLSDAKRRGRKNLEEVRDQYYERIALAFDWMEEKVQEGLFSWYGISSNTFPSPADDPEFTSLEHILRVADSVGENHHFAVVQFPMNLFETGAVTVQNQEGGTKTVLDLAREHNLATLFNRPLNAMPGSGGLVRLADFRAADPKKMDAEFEHRQAALAASEEKFRAEFLPALPAQLPRQHLDQVFSLSKQLAAARESFQSWENWDHVKQTAILPQIQSILGHLNQLLKNRPAWHPWAAAYLEALEAFLNSISQRYENLAGARSKRLRDRLDELAPALDDSATLSQKCLRLLRSLDGAGSVLLGMRRKEYVDDALESLRKPPIENALAVLTEPLKAIL